MDRYIDRLLPKLEIRHSVSKALNLQSAHLCVQRKVLQVKWTGSFDGQPNTPQDVASVHYPKNVLVLITQSIPLELTPGLYCQCRAFQFNQQFL